MVTLLNRISVRQRVMLGLLSPSPDRSKMLIRRGAHWALVGFACLATLIASLSFLLSSEASVFWGLLLGGLGVWTMNHYTRRKRIYYLPIIWTLFYIIGYVLGVADILTTSDIPSVGVKAEATIFEFTNNSFLPIAVTISAGLLGMFTAVAICEKLYGPGHSLAEKANGTRFSRTRWHGEFAIWGWAVLSVAIILSMNWLGIGRTGLRPETALPFKLTGILVYTKNVIIPFVGNMLLIKALEQDGAKALARQVVIALVVGGVGSFVFMSRSFIVEIGAVPFLYSLLSCRRRGSLIVSALILLMLVLALVFLVPAIQAVRDVRYAGGRESVAGVLASTENTDLKGRLMAVGSLAVARAVGFRELVGIHHMDKSDHFGPLKIFLMDEDYTEWSTLTLHGFQIDASSDVAFGYAYGLWGMLFLGGSNLIVFVGTGLFTALIIAFEEYFGRLGGRAFSLFVAFQMGLWIWGGIDYFLLSRLVMALLACAILLKVRAFRRLLVGSETLNLPGRSNPAVR